MSLSFLKPEMENTYALNEYDSDGDTKDSSPDLLNSLNISYNDIALKLINDKLLLTALELHAELIEAGKEIPKLREFFSNPGNFENQMKSDISPCIPRSSSQATLDSLDFTRFSEDGERGVDERVAVLEFELRKAKETINALRANLTVATDNEGASSRGGIEAIKPHEQRALNFLINEYLLINGYKLTSITFADENEHQDFEDWEDVGVNSGKPAELVELYRIALNSSNAQNQDTDISKYESSSQEDKFKNSPSSGSYEKVDKETIEIGIQCNIEARPVCEIRVDSPEEKLILGGFEEINQSLTDHIEENISAAINDEIDDGIIWKDKTDLVQKEEKDLILENEKASAIIIRESELEETSLHQKCSNESKPEAPNIPSGENSVEQAQGGKSLQGDPDESERKSKLLKGEPSIGEELNEGNNVINVVSDSPKRDESNRIQGPDSENISQDDIDFSQHDVSQESENSSINREISEGDQGSDKTPKLVRKELSEDVEGAQNQVEPTEPPSVFASGFARLVWAEVVKPLTLSSLGDLDSNSLVQLLASNFSLISQNLPLKNMQCIEFAVTLLVSVIHLIGDLKQQESLLHSLFNLRKRPNSKERDFILAGVTKVAEMGEPGVVEAVVLPQCCQLLGHRTAEKRLLAALAPAHLAAHIPGELRDSLLVSMLDQLLEDREEAVREACLGSLAALASLSASHKYPQIESMVLRCLEDPSEGVLQGTLRLLLPVVARWALKLHCFHTSLLHNMLNEIQQSTKTIGLVEGVRRVVPHIIVFLASSQHVLEHVSSSLPPVVSRSGISELCRGLSNPLLFFQHETHNLAEAISAFDYCLMNDQSWPELQWFFDIMLESLMQSVKKVESEDDLKAFISLFSALSIGLGPHLTSTKVKAVFIEKLNNLEVDILEKRPARTALIPIYIISIASQLPEKESEVLNVISRFVVTLTLANSSLNHLAYTLSHLCSSPLSEIVPTALWQGVVDNRNEVRLGTVSLMASVIERGHVPPSLLPPLITLASDQQTSVRVSTLSVFSYIMEYSSDKQVIEKTRVQIQNLVSDRIIREQMASEVVTALGKISPHANQTFREEIIVPELSGFVGNLTDCIDDLPKRQQLAAALVDAYTSTIYCQISKPTITNVIYALRQLEIICSECLPAHSETVSAMIKEMDSRAETPRQVPRSGSTLSLGSEDMRQRVSRMFTTAPNLPSLFKKK